MVISMDDAQRQFAFVKGNRPTNEKVVKQKEQSFKAYGQLTPITVVDGEKVAEMGGHLVDLEGQDIPDEQATNYYAVLDGQHRLMAYLNLKLNLDDLVICEPLNAEMSIVALIAEMNICTTTWKGANYLAAPAMLLNDTNEVFKFAIDLQNEDFPLSTISLWCLGSNSLKSKTLVKCLETHQMPKVFENTGWYERSSRWYEAARKRFPLSFLKKKYLIANIIKMYNNAKDPVAFSSELEEKLSSLTLEQVNEIMNPKRKHLQGQDDAINEMIHHYLNEVK